MSKNSKKVQITISQSKTEKENRKTERKQQIVVAEAIECKHVFLD